MPPSRDGRRRSRAASGLRDRFLPFFYSFPFRILVFKGRRRPAQEAPSRGAGCKYSLLRGNRDLLHYLIVYEALRTLPHYERGNRRFDPKRAHTRPIFNSYEIVCARLGVLASKNSRLNEAK